MQGVEEFRFGGFRLAPERRMLWLGDEPQHLGARAFDLLLALVARQGRIATKDELMAEIWPGAVVEENSLAAQVSLLRKVLRDDPQSAQLLRTIPGRPCIGTRLPGRQIDGWHERTRGSRSPLYSPESWTPRERWQKSFSDWRRNFA